MRKAASLAALEQSITAVLSKPSDLVIVLAGDVDRAGHSYGAASPQYREAAVAMGAAIGRLVPQLDLTKDTVIVPADHGLRRLHDRRRLRPVQVNALDGDRH